MDPHTSFAWRLVELYKRAWETHDESLLADLFHPGAVYHEKPFDPPLVGLREIAAYWRRNRDLQRNVAFQPIRVAGGEGQVVAEWRCQFYRQDLERRLVLQGVFWAEVRDDRIVRFVEYFEKKLGA